MLKDLSRYYSVADFVSGSDLQYYLFNDNFMKTIKDQKIRNKLVEKN